MRQQGINGPYRFIHGNTKEIMSMKQDSMNSPCGLSDNLFPRFDTHLHFWLITYGRNFLNWHGPQAEIVITELEFVKEILNQDQVYLKIDVPYPKMMFGDGLAISRGEKWAKHRKLANHAFHFESLKSMPPTMIASTEMMLERWRQHQEKEIEVFAEFHILTSEIISRTAFGSSYLEGKDIFDKLGRIGSLIGRNLYKAKLPGLSRCFKNDEDVEAEKLEQGIYDAIVRNI